jgi:putative ABC transport system permease protein
VPGDERQGEVRLQQRGQEHLKGAVSSGGVDETFIPFFKVRLLSGRNFIANDRSDVCILSRRSVERLGYKSPASAIGSRVLVDDGKNVAFGGVMMEMEIIGVIEDFMVNPSSAFDDGLIIEGICLFYGLKTLQHLPPRRIALRMESQNFAHSLATLRTQFQDVFADSAMDWYFLDGHFNKAYDHEKTIRNQIGLFAALAIGISSLGMLGMISIKVERRTKELGIRKVLGANLNHLAGVLLRETMRQLLVAIFLGIPIASYAGRLYLDKYSQRIDLAWWHLALPVIILVLIMFSTIASLLVRAMRANPVEALKYE